MQQKKWVFFILWGALILSFLPMQKVSAAPYNYSRYTVSAQSTYIMQETYVNLYEGTNGLEHFTGINLNSATGIFTEYGTKKSVWFNAGETGYKRIDDALAMKYVLVENTSGYNIKLRMYELVPSLKTVESAGNYLGSVTAENGTYPANGKHTDGYWYIRGSAANTPPTVPGNFLTPTASTVLKGGASMVVNWGTSNDADGNAITYELQFYNGSTWTTLASTGVRTYTHPLPAINTASAQYRVRAYDGTAYSAYRTSSAFLVDSTSPAGVLTQDKTTLTDQAVIITASGADTGGAGFDRIKKPDGTYASGSTVTYAVDTNGTYTFTFEDKAGNTSEKSITISNIVDDLGAVDPTAAYPFYLGKNMTIHAGLNSEPYTYLGVMVSRYLPTTDNSPNASDYTKPYVHADGTSEWFLPKTQAVRSVYALPFQPEAEYHKRLFSQVGTNAIYKMQVKHVYRLPDGRDIVGNTQTLYYALDITPPVGTLSQSPNTFTRGSVNITATGIDTGVSGFRRIKTPDGVYTDDTVTHFVVHANNTYVFEFEDNAGNISRESVTVSNIDTESPVTTFDLSTRDGGTEPVAVGLTFADRGVSGFKDYRYLWTKETTRPASGWSAGVSETVTQPAEGIWYLHVEASDNVGNIGYQYAGPYRVEVKPPPSKPSVTIAVHPQPTGKWESRPIDTYVTDSGDVESLESATKKYEVTSTPAYPSTFTKMLPADQKVTLSQVGVQYLHIQYTLADGTVISNTAGPYLIDTGDVGDFTVKLTKKDGSEAVGWSNDHLNLVIGDPSGSSISGIVKQYRIEHYHLDWQTYTPGTAITVEGSNRVFARIVTKAGVASEQQVVTSRIDQSTPTLRSLSLALMSDRTYQVRAGVTDHLSGVKSVQLQSGEALQPTNQLYSIQHLTTKPVSVTLTDHAGNQQTGILFAAEPTVTFDAPYTLGMDVYRTDVKARISGAHDLSYQFGNKHSVCKTKPCEVTIPSNGTFTAVHTEGHKQTTMTFAIGNIDKSPLKLLLNGNREANDPTKIQLKWNYPLTGGTLTCVSNGVTKTDGVTGTSLSFLGKNFTYDCFVKGMYGGEELTSNRILLYPDATFPLEGETARTTIPKTTNVQVEESRIGTSYIINAKSDNYKSTELPFPKNSITEQ